MPSPPHPTGFWSWYRSIRPTSYVARRIRLFLVGSVFAAAFVTWTIVRLAGLRVFENHRIDEALHLGIGLVGFILVIPTLAGIHRASRSAASHAWRICPTCRYDLATTNTTPALRSRTCPECGEAYTDHELLLHWSRYAPRAHAGVPISTTSHENQRA
jgi:uncharacterized SAM-binding protein YcdF (DUF218 family)